MPTPRIDTSPAAIARVLREYAGFELADAEDEAYKGTPSYLAAAEIRFARVERLNALADALDQQAAHDLRKMAVQAIDADNILHCYGVRPENRGPLLAALRRNGHISLDQQAAMPVGTSYAHYSQVSGPPPASDQQANSPTWSERVERAARADCGPGARKISPNTPASIAIADHMLRAAFPELAPTEEHHK